MSASDTEEGLQRVCGWLSPRREMCVRSNPSTLLTHFFRGFPLWHVVGRLISLTFLRSFSFVLVVFRCLAFFLITTTTLLGIPLIPPHFRRLSMFLSVYYFWKSFFGRPTNRRISKTKLSFLSSPTFWFLILSGTSRWVYRFTAQQRPWISSSFITLAFKMALKRELLCSRLAIRMQSALERRAELLCNELLKTHFLLLFLSQSFLSRAKNYVQAKNFCFRSFSTRGSGVELGGWKKLLRFSCSNIKNI